MNQQIIVRTKRSTDEVESVYFGDEDMLQEERSSTDKSLQVDLMEIDLSEKPHSSSNTYHEVLQALLKLDRVNDGYAIEDLMAELIKQGMEVSGRLEKKHAIK
jgi:2-methylcitrate dehydratase PrpD